MTKVAEITATNPRPSDCMEGDAQDVDVFARIAGQAIHGEVTLARSQAHPDRYCADFPEPDVWVSGALLRALRESTDDDEFREALTAIQDAAREAIEEAS